MASRPGSRKTKWKQRGPSKGLGHSVSGDMWKGGPGEQLIQGRDSDAGECVRQKGALLGRQELGLPRAAAACRGAVRPQVHRYR